ncbi:unnamed protein product [marine sediment metagenome]|uniref:PIN domain-containing protein n=1 Tax=marine sediment metagenome TaxID=412755 RepID=X1DIB3_9ZZZZ
MDVIVVLDTSVIIKWYRQEEILAKKALALRESYLLGRIAVCQPSLAACELANVLRYKSELSTRAVREAMDSFFNMGFDFVSSTRNLIDRAVPLARENDVTVYDALFAAVAESKNGYMITADRKLHDRLSSFSFVHFLASIDRFL